MCFRHACSAWRGDALLIKKGVGHFLSDRFGMVRCAMRLKCVFYGFLDVLKPLGCIWVVFRR